MLDLQLSFHYLGTNQHWPSIKQSPYEILAVASLTRYNKSNRSTEATSSIQTDSQFLYKISSFVCQNQELPFNKIHLE